MAHLPVVGSMFSIATSARLAKASAEHARDACRITALVAVKCQPARWLDTSSANCER